MNESVKSSANGKDPNAIFDDVEKDLIQEISKLSMQDRNKIQEEIHGVGTVCPEETPEMMEHALRELQQEIDAIPNRRVYDRASPFSYIHTKEFRLKFLRCELYDCKKAAERLLRYTEYMEEEYDMEVVERPLKIQDLKTKCCRGKEVMESFKSGHTQTLPFRDRSGRKIITTHVPAALQYEAEIRYKTYQYLLDIAANDEETQKKGVVFVFWGKGGSIPFPDYHEQQMATRLFQDLPIRLVCIHQCFDNTPVLQICRAVNALMLKGAKQKVRLLTHLGDNWEVRYNLLSYGIPVDLLPITDTNNVKTKNFVQWVKGRQAIEELKEQKRNNNDDSSMHLVDCPLSSDIVFKIGTSNLTHPGNVTYREVLQSNLQAFNQAQANATTKKVVNKIMTSVIAGGGRFLEWSAIGCWIVMQDPAKLQVKIYHSLYQLQKSTEAQKRRQTHCSSTFMFERQDGKKRKRHSADEMDKQCCTKPLL